MKKLLLFNCFLFLICFSKAQTCGTCTINITGFDSTSYTVSTGQILCIDSTGNFVGNITLSGGIICNKGLFNPKSFSFTNGTFSNYGNAFVKTSVVLTAYSDLNNNADAIMNIINSLTLSGGTLSNNGVINVSQNIQNNSGSFTNTSVINCAALSGTGSIANTGVINSN